MNMTEGEVINTRDLPKYLKDVLIIINEAIRRCHGNKTEAAKVLGLHRSVLYKKLNKLGIS
jgi:DNA-binding NtrC family response regulator